MRSIHLLVFGLATLLWATRSSVDEVAEYSEEEKSWSGESISEDDGTGPADEPPRMSGSELANLATLVLPDPRDVVDRCVWRLPKTKHNRPPNRLPNRDYHFFFDLEDTIYTRRDVQVRKYEFLATFLHKQMGIEDEKEIKDFILHQKTRLNQFLEFKNVKYEDTYTFIQPDKAVTALVSSIKANRWIFTKSNLYSWRNDTFILIV